MNGDVEMAVLFGSRAMENHKPGSDVDIALKGAAVNRQTVVDVSCRLNEETLMPYHFDVLDFRTIDNPSLHDHINRVGKVIYERPLEEDHSLLQSNLRMTIEQRLKRHDDALNTSRLLKEAVHKKPAHD